MKRPSDRIIQLEVDVWRPRGSPHWRAGHGCAGGPILDDRREYVLQPRYVDLTTSRLVDQLRKVQTELAHAHQVQAPWNIARLFPSLPYH